jgi:hypothetical protein
VGIEVMEDNNKDLTGTSAASSQDQWQYELQLACIIDSASKEALWSMLVENTENTVRLLSKNSKGLDKLQDALRGRRWEEEQPILEALHMLNTFEGKRLLQSYVYHKLDSSYRALWTSVFITLIGVGGIAWFIHNYNWTALHHMEEYRFWYLWLPVLLMLALPIGLIALVSSIDSYRKDPNRKDPKWYGRYLTE